MRLRKTSRRGSAKFVKIKDAFDLIDHEVDLLGVVVESRQPKRTRGTDWICSLVIRDESYSDCGLTVNVFTSTLEELPHVKSLEDIILLTRVKIKLFDGDRVSVAYNKRVSSFALYEEDYDEDFVRYQHSARFQDKLIYKNSIDNLGKWLASRKALLGEKGYNTFSFLTEIIGGKRFNLACKILHVNEDRSVIFVWDGTDAPPATILAKEIKDDLYSSLRLCTFLSRDVLLELPTNGTILRVSAYNRFSCKLKLGHWVKLRGLLCEVDRGTWVGRCIDSTKVTRIRDDSFPSREVRIKLYGERVASKSGCMPSWCFPDPPGLTEKDHDLVAPFVTLMEILTFPKVTCMYECVVRVVAAYPWQVENFTSRKSGRYRILLTLEDPTAVLKAFLCDEEAEKFWGGYHTVEILRKKRNLLLGIQETESGSEDWAVPRNPPWIECCLISYYRDKTDPWNARYYRIFNTRLVV